MIPDKILFSNKKKKNTEIYLTYKNKQDISDFSK